ncbi:MAG TPA: TonB-dependent receptor, partial [Spirochaetia bacterium]|nr:TonB-dependent receptor [Spirochaetia bacterium]
MAYARISLLASLTLLSVIAWAQDVHELPETVVTATREPTDIQDSPSFVTVVTQKDIQESGASDLSAVLARQSGVVVNNYGSQGQTKTVSIRGSTSSQVLVLVDGVRLNSSFDGSVDFSQIPVSDIDHVEIVRGGASSLWGTGAVGGVINIITKKAGAPGVIVSFENGSYLPHDATAVTESGTYSVPATAMSLFDNQNLNLSLTGKLGDVGLTGGGSFTRGMNAFLWDDTASLGGWRQRNNAQDLAQNAYLGMDLPLLGGSFSAKGTFGHSLIGVPGSLAGASSQQSQEDTEMSGSFSYGTASFFSDKLSLDVKGTYRFSTEYLQNPGIFTSSHTGNFGSIDLTQKFAFSEAASAIYGGTGTYETMDSTNLSGGKDRISLAGFLSLPLSPAEPHTVTPSLRYDYYSDFPGFLSFQLGTVLLLSDTTSVKASFGSAYRVPTFEDLYWYSFDGSDSFGDTFYSYGNPNLLPETSYNAELGASYS